MSEGTVTVKNICNIHHTLKGIYCWDCVAEISFKAGIREVVEWIKNHGGSLDGFRKEWQAKLKEWGHLQPERKGEK